jgi:hypothetical protein
MGEQRDTSRKFNREDRRPVTNSIKARDTENAGRLGACDDERTEKRTCYRRHI